MKDDLGNYRTSRMPDDKDQNFGWTIKRAGTDSTLKLIILSSDIFGIRTHFFRGRTGPCHTNDCPACAAKHLSRWKGYVLALDALNGQQFLFEFTPPAAKALDEARQKFGTMRGLGVYVSRASKKANAKVLVTVKNMVGVDPHACPDYHVWPILAHIWGLMDDLDVVVRSSDPKDLAEFENAA